MATIDGSIMLIALPDIFRGIHLNPLVPGQQLLLAVDDPRLPGRDERAGGEPRAAWATCTAGCGCTTSASSSSRSFSLLLTVTWMTGRPAAAVADRHAGLPGRRRGVPAGQLGRDPHRRLPRKTSGAWRSGINSVAGVSGSFIGLVLGGVLAPIHWRLVFLVSVPVGLFGTVWAYLKLRGAQRAEARARSTGRGNLTFALGLIADHGRHHLRHPALRRPPMGWTSPCVLALLGGGVGAPGRVRRDRERVAEPMFRLPLFRIRAFTAGTLSTSCSADGRGGLQFMLIIWLQGIWLPQHGYSFSQTPLWAGIYMLPLTVGFLVAGPVSGYLSDRFGARPVRHRRDARRGAQLPAARDCCRSTSPTLRSR